MAVTPFPHILDFGGGIMKVITDTPVNEGQYLLQVEGQKLNVRTDKYENQYVVHQIKKIIDQRQPKGDWSAYPALPTLYQVQVEPIGKVEEKDITPYLN